MKLWLDSLIIFINNNFKIIYIYFLLKTYYLIIMINK